MDKPTLINYIAQLDVQIRNRWSICPERGGQFTPETGLYQGWSVYPGNEWSIRPVPPIYGKDREVLEYQIRHAREWGNPGDGE